jgi:hypothetical protein
VKIRQLIGGIIAVPLVFAMPFVWISGAILHFFTAFIAYGLAGPGFWGYMAAGAAFTFPILAEIAVLMGAWNTTGSFINGYSQWLLLWLVFAAGLLGLIAFGSWLASGED